MTTDLFLCSYLPDLEWVKYSLRSVDKYVRGVRQVVVVVPHSDVAAFAPVCSKSKTPLKLLGFTPGRDGHMDQTGAKTSPDLYSDADLFLHFDSDRMFLRECSPETFTKNGLPEIWFERYDKMVGEWQGHPGGIPWQEITAHALGFPVEVETMRRLPVLLPAWLHRATREQIELVHKIPFAEYVQSAPKLGRAFHGYSEFNALGCLAYYRHSEKFAFTDWIANAKEPDLSLCFWSHYLRSDPAKFEQEIRPQLEALLA